MKSSFFISFSKITITFAIITHIKIKFFLIIMFGRNNPFIFSVSTFKLVEKLPSIIADDIFIHQQNERQRKLILVLAYGRNIAKEIRAKLRAEKIKVYDRLKNILPALNHHHTCSLDKCPTYLENMKPLALVCTVHSLANG